MADQSLIPRLIRTVLAVGVGLMLATMAGCGDAPLSAKRAPATANDETARAAAPFPDDERAWPRYHSTRFRLSVPLPDGKTWKIDDHTRPELRAAQASTRSRLTVFASAEPELMNRARCEARARERGLVPTESLKTVEDGVTVGPEAFDTRLWVAVDANGDKNAALTGHVMIFGAFVRRCLFLHFETEVASAKDEPVLAARLALAKVRLLGGLALDPPRTTGDAEVPREKEGEKR